MLATWFLPLGLSHSVVSLINLEFSHCTWKLSSHTWNLWYLVPLFTYLKFLIPGIVSVATVILSGIYVYCSAMWTFPKLLNPLPHMYAFHPYTLYYISHFTLQFIPELKQFVECLLFCYFILFTFCLFVVRAQRRANFVVIAQFYTAYNSTVSLCFHAFRTTIYCLLFKICCKPITV